MSSIPPAESVTPSSASESMAGLMPQLGDELAQLVAIQCVSAPGFPEVMRPALVGVRYDKWIRFTLPLMTLLAVACFVMLGIAALLE